MSRTLLLADENVTTHRIVALTFAEHDVRVISVLDGVEAIERMKRDRPDIILADANVPRLDGYKLAQYVTSQPSLAGVPVLLLTGAFDTIDESRVRESGAAGVIVKPFEPAVVLNRVKELLGFGDKPAPPPPEAPRRVPMSAVPESRPPRPSGGGPQPVVPRTGPVAVPPAREAHLPAAPAAWDELRHESGLGAGAAPVEGQSGTAEDYFERLDAAFDTLDAQLAGRLPNRPASAHRDLRPSGDPTQTSARPQLNTAETVAAAADPPVFEVDEDWFAELPGAEEARPLSSASSQPRRVEATRPAPDSFPAPAAPVAPPTPAAFAAPPAPPAIAEREAPAAPATPAAPPASAALAATPAPVAPPALAAPAAPPAVPVPAAPEHQAPPEQHTAPEQSTTPSAPEYLTAPSAPAAPEHRTAPSAPDAPGASFAPIPHIADAFDALLAAEERRDRRVIAAREQQMSEFSDELIDRIAARVAERLADGVLIDAVRKGVAAITERLVRDEIERNRTNAQRKT